jgi:alanine racemase
MRMTDMIPARARCWVEIELEALSHNAAVARERAGRDSRVLAVVKADAYGLGAVEVSRHLAAKGVRDFGVANLAEAESLRAVLPPEVSIELLSPALPAEWPAIARLDLTPWLSSVEEARGYARAAIDVGHIGPVPVVVEVDTGMGRTGVLPAGLSEMLDAIAKLPTLRLVGVATHLPSSDEDFAFTTAQLAAFGWICRDRPWPNQDFHTQARNSAGVLGYPASDGEFVRAGLMLYGVSPLADQQRLLRPVLTWKTRVTLVRDMPAGHGISYGRTFITPRPMRVATLAVGYADGYMRSLADKGAEVLVRGRRRALLGRVTMDQMMVDASDAPDIAVGDEAVLLGRQGEDEISAAEVAERAGTIAWEIFTGLSPRVTRVYL